MISFITFQYLNTHTHTLPVRMHLILVSRVVMCVKRKCFGPLWSPTDDLPSGGKMMENDYGKCRYVLIRTRTPAAAANEIELSRVWAARVGRVIYGSHA